MHCTLNKNKLFTVCFCLLSLKTSNFHDVFQKGSTLGSIELLSLRAACAIDSITSIMILHLAMKWNQCSVSVLTKIKLSKTFFLVQTFTTQKHTSMF